MADHDNTPAPAQPTQHLRDWDRIAPTAQMRLADDMVDAILCDVFQGRRDHLRDHLRAVAYKQARKHPWPYFEECVAAEVARRLAANEDTHA